MKSRLTLSLILLSCIYFACRKNDNDKPVTAYEDPIKQGAVSYLKTQLNNENLYRLDLNSIQTFKLNEQLTMVQIRTRYKPDSEQIFLTYDQHAYQGNWVFFDYKGSYRNGIIRSKSFDNEIQHEVTFVNGKVVKLVVQDHGQTHITVVRHPRTNIPGAEKTVTVQLNQSVQITETGGGGGNFTLPPVIVTGYIYNNANTALQQLFSLYYLNYSAGLRYTYSTTPPNNGVSPSEGVATNYYSGPSVIGNISDYNKCFTNVSGSNYKYSITLCVDQPSASSRSAWGYSQNGSSGSGNGGNPVDVGHTFLILTEETPNGTITRNVGFYPQGAVSPLDPTDRGQLNNNESHFYDVGLKITVTNSQFFNAVNYVNKGNGFFYDLNTNNCTTFSLAALSAAGINIASATGSWPGGSGKDPGDLGEDIRTMTLNSNMTRITKYSSHPNTGNCN